MIPSVNYLQPASLQEVLEALDFHKSDARLLAGGTDIVPGLQQGSRRFRNIKLLINISSLDELKEIRLPNNYLILGAGVTFTQILKSPPVEKHFPLLREAASSLGSVQIRNRATLAGNFVNNAPCADSVPPLLVYEAKVRLRSLHQEREILLADLLKKPYQTKVRPEEVVTEIRLPVLPEGYRGSFYKLGRRRAVAVSRITLAVLADIRENRFRDIRIASSAVTPVGMRFPELEEQARGREITEDLLTNLSQEIGRQVLQASGLRWSSAYKLPVLQQMFHQILNDYCEQ